MKTEVHPLSGATYTELGEGKVRVDKAQTVRDLRLGGSPH